MTNSGLAGSYLTKARARLKILPVLLAERAYSDVLREAQEIVELSLKGMLRQVGVEPPKWHDVGPLLLEHATRFPQSPAELEGLAEISARLRKEREFAFYGDIDFIPTERYSIEDAERALRDAEAVVAEAGRVIGGSG
ncbi:MAG: HEPN domain-containing protein [Thermoanaerobaculia bacterium]